MNNKYYLNNLNKNDYFFLGKMSFKKKLEYKTLIGSILLNIIIGTYRLSPNLFNYFYSYLQYTNENIYTREKVQILLDLSNIIYLLSIPLGIVLNLYFNINTNTITGISLLLRILSIYILIYCSNNKLFIFYLLIKSCSCGLCILPILLENWKYFPNKKGLITGIFYFGKGISYFLYEFISLKIINQENISIIQIKYIYPTEINENYFNYLKICLIFTGILSSIIQCLIYPYSIYINYFEYRKYKFRGKMNKGLINDFYILSSPSRNTTGSTKSNNSENMLDINENKDNNKEIKEPFISLIISYPFIQLTFIYFLIMTFNLIDLSSINKLGLYNNFGQNFISHTNIIWKFTYILWNIISGYLLDKIKFKKLLVIFLIIQIFLISICYFISNNMYGFILYNIINSVINSCNSVIVPISFNIIFGDENGLLLYGISSLIINTFYIYRNYIGDLLVEKIYYFVLCLICTIFYMIALITLCLFEEKKHVYKVIDENQEQIMFNDIGQELDDIDICNENEFKKNDNK